jgi:hypothetical protein
MNDPTRLSRKQVQENLNPRLLIFNALIPWSRVDGGTTSLAGARSSRNMASVLSQSRLENRSEAFGAGASRIETITSITRILISGYSSDL